MSGQLRSGSSLAALMGQGSAFGGLGQQGMGGFDQMAAMQRERYLEMSRVAERAFLYGDGLKRPEPYNRKPEGVREELQTEVDEWLSDL